MARQASQGPSSEVQALLGFVEVAREFLAETDPSFAKLFGLRERPTKPTAGRVARASEARAGARQGASDMLQFTKHLTTAQMQALDERLLARALPTLTSLRLKLWARKVPAILKRRRIRDSTEYHLLKEMVDGPGSSLDAASLRVARQLVDAYSIRGTGDA